MLGLFKKLGVAIFALTFLLYGTVLFASEKELIGAGATFPQPLY